MTSFLSLTGKDRRKRVRQFPKIEKKITEAHVKWPHPYHKSETILLREEHRKTCAKHFAFLISSDSCNNQRCDTVIPILQVRKQRLREEVTYLRI